MVYPSSGGLYYIVNVASGTRVDLNNGSYDNGTKVQGWTGGDSDNQRWTFRSAESGYWFVECRASMTRLDLNNGSNRNGTKVQGWDPAWSQTQMWMLFDEGGDRYRIRNRASNTDLDLNNGSNSNGTTIQGWDEGNTDNQRWRFQAVDEYLSYSEGHYKDVEFGAKLIRCKEMIELAKADSNSKHCYGTAFNMSQFGSYNPIEAQQWMSGGIDEMLSPNNIGRDGAYRIGSIGFDFYENNLAAVQNVIRSNRGCGSL